MHTRCQGRPWIGAPVHRRSVGDRTWLRRRPERAGSAASGSVRPERRAILSHDTIRHDLSSVTCSPGGTAHLGSVWACPGMSSGSWRHLSPPLLCTATSALWAKMYENLSSRYYDENPVKLVGPKRQFEFPRILAVSHNSRAVALSIYRFVKNPYSSPLVRYVVSRCYTTWLSCRTTIQVSQPAGSLRADARVREVAPGWSLEVSISWL